MSESPREVAMQAIVALPGTAMQGTRYWGGAYPMPVRAHRGYLGPDQVTEWPLLCFFEASGSRMDFEATGSSFGHVVDHFLVTAIGYVRGNDATPPEVWRERLYYDWWTTYFRQPLPIGLIRNFNFGNQPRDLNEGTGEAVAWWQQTFEAVIDDDVQAA